jgi:hypothetical protein
LLTFCISTRELNALFICRFFLPWIRHWWPSDYAYELGLVAEERRVMVNLGIQLSICGFTNHLLQNMTSYGFKSFHKVNQSHNTFTWHFWICEPFFTEGNQCRGFKFSVFSAQPL